MSLLRLSDFEDAFRLFNKSDYQIKRDENAVTLSLEIPGVKREDITVKAEGQYLYIDSADKRYHWQFSMGYGLDTGNITAKLDLGILTLIIPLLEQSKKRDIVIT